MKKTINQLKNGILSVLNKSIELDSAVNEVIQMVGQYFKVDRVYIFENIENDTCCRNTFEWCNENIAPEIDHLQHLEYVDAEGDDFRHNYNEEGLFFCPSIHDLPERQRMILEPQGIFSMLHCAIMERGEFKGYIGFDNCQDHLVGWENNQDAIDTLIFASHLLSIYLLEYRNKEELIRMMRLEEEKKESLQKALDDAVRGNQIINHVAGMDYDYIMVVEADRDFYQIYVNEQDASMSTVAKSGCYSQMITDYANQYVLPEDRRIAIDELGTEYMVKKLETKSELISQARLTEPDGRECIKRVKISYLNREEKKILLTRTDITDFILHEKENTLKKKTLENVSCNDYDFVALINTYTGKMCMMATRDPLLQPLLDKNWDLEYNHVIETFAKTYRSFYQTDDDFHAVSDGMRLSRIMELLDHSDEYEFTCKTESKEKGVTTFRLRFSYMDETHKYIIYSRSNITEAVRDELKTQQKLKEALETAKEASRAKTDFFARMSHDIRTPMNAIIGLTALSLDEKDVPDPIRENLTNIRGSGDFLLGLVNDILDMSKIESGAVKLKKEPYHYMDFLAKLKAMFGPQCKAKNISFDFEDVTVSTCIQTDILRMDQIFFNIISNAVKYTPEGGCIRYYTENLLAEGDHVSADYIIEDNGIGMSEAFVKKMFDPFEQEDTEYSSNLKGTGLGLSIAKSLVDLMGGSIKVESREHKGTKVVVHLGFSLCPDQENRVDKKELDTVDKTGLLSKKRILLVEDHPLNAKIAKKLLEKKGMDVYHAENGKIAVDYFEMSMEHFYDAILMDIRMPVMDGLEAARKIRSLDRLDAKHVPMIAMSANAYDEDVQKSLDAGMNSHLAKPVDPKILYQTLAEFISE